MFYHVICSLRTKAQWQSVLNALNDLERQQPGFPGAAELRSWAEAYQRCEQILTAWNSAVVALEVLLKESPVPMLIYKGC